MMQQSMCQQDQNMSGQQQAVGQQMVLCPVRFVYETQILMQPGEQMHSNQAILIQPQNTPPWIQNRQVANPILYVHQVPNNIVPSIQQQIDQNQLYMQQLANYQMPQMIQNQDQQIRPNIQMMQMSNVGTNMQLERHVGQPSNQLPPNQIIVPNRQMVNVGNQNTVYAQSDLQRQLFMNVRPMNQTRPAVNPIQNVQQNMNVMPANPNVGQFVPNVRTRPQMQQQVKMEVTDRNEVMTNVIAPQRQVQNYPYKPIQPRPQFRTVYNSTVTQTPVAFANNPPNAINNNINKITNQVTPKANYYVNNMDSNNVNRKRKSESPDEIQKKMSINSRPKSPEPVQFGSMIVKHITKSIDVGVNTNPVNRRPNRPPQPQITLPMKPQEIKKSTDVNIAQANDNKSNIVISVAPNTDRQSNINLIEALKTPVVQHNVSVEEKLVRKTVYTQAKGRVLNDKELRPNSIENMQQNLDDFNKMQRNSDEANNLVKTVSDTNSEQFNDFIVPEIPMNRSETKKEDVKPLKKEEISTPSPAVEVKKVQLNDIESKKEKQFLLTHVLDGFVIQESNMAFPIRKPLKEKLLQGNTKEMQEQQNTDTEPKEEADEDKTVDVTVLPFHCLQLNNENKDDVKEENKGNPFESLQQSIVKNWTVKQISTHLSKYDWSETVALLQEQEIDGVSLFLVTKPQLLNIGIKESHADMISEFVKS